AHLLHVVAAEERGPIQAGIDDQRLAGVAAGRREAEVLGVKDAEAAGDGLLRAGRRYLPRDRRRLAERSGRGLYNQRPVGGEGEPRGAVDVDDYLAEVRSGLQQHVVLQLAGPLLHAQVHTVIESLIEDAAVGGDVRDPPARIVSEEEVVVTALFGKPHD